MTKIKGFAGSLKVGGILANFIPADYRRWTKSVEAKLLETQTDELKPKTIHASFKKPAKVSILATHL